ncbi:MAG: aspartate--tRNA ligase [Bacilli bacterium]
MEKLDRTNYNAEMSLSMVGMNVALIGWVSKKRDLGSITFVDLRDKTGIVQLLINHELKNFPNVRNEYLIHVYGQVVKKEVPNKLLKTGEVEIEVHTLEIINESDTTPLIIDDKTDASEEVRLKYRYLDLRRPCLQNNLMLRAKIVKCAHEYLDNNNFLEIETPILGASTPEGAREYLVPSRVNHGQFYALPQSPQLFKQLLMIAGFERYYQVAKCFRDEDLRADRQPDFTQIDIETSFLNQDELLKLMEGLLEKIFKETINYDIHLPLRQMEYDEAVNVYGSDKPDTRFDLKIHDLTSILSTSNFEYFNTVKYIKGFVVKNKAEVFSRKYVDNLSLLSKKYSMRNYFVIKFVNGELEGSLVKSLTEENKVELIKEFNLLENDVICIAASDIKYDVNFGLGALRSQLGHEFKLINTDIFDVLWVVHWPLFAYDEHTGTLAPEHHPFTRPCDEDLKKLDTNPRDVYAYCYDIIINGYEAGGGSLRIYKKDVQSKVFNLLGFTDEDIKRKFGFFIDAFNYGTPPHAGIAFGLERLTMCLAKTDNIKDVIAFPKNLKARCPMTNAPSNVTDKQLEELGIKITEENTNE